MSLLDTDLYFYELHEGDEELFSDVLLVHQVEFDEEQFLDLVKEARAAVIDRFEEDSIAQAIARELERRHGFLAVHDGRIRVSVHVSTDEEEIAVAEGAEGTDEESEAEYRSILIEVDPEDARLN
jgi:hypothetical protein